MKIVIKEMNQEGSELLIYVMVDENTALNLSIVDREDEEDVVNELIEKHLIEYCAENGHNLDDRIELIKYQEYINEN